jgi:plasmid stabilization system protein ParE
LTAIRFLAEAAEELQVAVEYYDSQAAGLGREFALEVQRLSELIAENPHIGSQVRAHIRRRALRRFPFYVLYTVEEDDVLILAVAHHRRAPGYWRDRV